MVRILVVLYRSNELLLNKRDINCILFFSYTKEFKFIRATERSVASHLIRKQMIRVAFPNKV